MPNSAVRAGSASDALAVSSGLHLFLLVLVGLFDPIAFPEAAPEALQEVALVPDPEPQDDITWQPVDWRDPSAVADAEALPEADFEPSDPLPQPEPIVPPPPEAVLFLRSDGLASADDVDSRFVSDLGARADHDGRSLADVVAASTPSPFGPLPTPESGTGPDPQRSKALEIPKSGETDAGNDRPLPGAPAPETGVTRPSTPAPAAPSSKAISASTARAARNASAPAGDSERAADGVAAGHAFSEAMAARAERAPTPEVDGRASEVPADGEVEEIAVVALADLAAVPDDPEGGGAEDDGRRGAAHPTPARSGSPGRHTIAGPSGTPSQLQAAPDDLPLDVGATLSVAGHPLGPWLVVLDRALRERWHPGAELRMRAGATAVVSFWVSRQGHVSGVELRRASGQPVLDALALAAIPAKVPPPAAFEGPAIHVQYSFRTGP